MKKIWTEEYRPSMIDDVILPERIKSTFRDIIETGNMPNLILNGSAGTGKTSVAVSLCEELGVDYLMINASNDRNIETLRNKVLDFASTMSIDGKEFRVVIFDEADSMNPNSTQPALRGIIEEVADNCRFIFTCNKKGQIIPPIHSRCSVIDFSFTAPELQSMAGKFMGRLMGILDEHGIEYEKPILAKLIQTYCKYGSPDWRRILNECQRYAVSGVIDKGIFDDLGQNNIDALIDTLKRKHYDDMCRWVEENTNLNPADIFGGVYNSLSRLGVDKKTLPIAAMIIGEWSYKSAFAVDQVVNTRACMTELMTRLEWL